MIEYFKLILTKVSFEPTVFEKELKKAISSGLPIEELKEFKRWCYRTYGSTHLYILDKCFFKLPQLMSGGM
jgi:hypothetical protein